MLIVALSVALAVLSYRRLEPTATASKGPMTFRAVAWASVGLLLLNVSCPPAGVGRPLVLLDASLSMQAAGGRWAEAERTARSLGDMQPFGAQESFLPDSVQPLLPSSLLAPALRAASATGRPLVVVTDGELDDLADIPPGILSPVQVQVFLRRDTVGIGMTAVTGPDQLLEGDSLRLAIELELVNMAQALPVRVEVRSGDTVQFMGQGTIPSSGIARLALAGPLRLPPGTHILDVALADSLDSERRDDHRAFALTIRETPGIVMVVPAPNSEARFLYRTLRDISALPLRGFVQVAVGQWRRMEDLGPVPESIVRTDLAAADLVVDFGVTLPLPTVRALWDWPIASDVATLPGDWYVSPEGPSPVLSALAAFPVESLPPAMGLRSLQDGTQGASWVGLSAQLGRRGAVRPAMRGLQLSHGRRVEVALRGLWRWAFRGGAAEQAYRSWVEGTVGWLLGGVDSTLGVASPVRPVVSQGEPVQFRWQATRPPTPTVVTTTPLPDGIPQVDTLTFDGSGRAALRRVPGTYQYSLDAGGNGVLVVEEYSAEWLPRRPGLQPSEPVVSVTSGRRSVREWPWLFFLAVVAFAGEWFVRRRGGLR